MQLNKTLVIIGGGPRGLAVAIQAIDKFKNVYIIDDTPTCSWNSLSTVANFNLRSPVSFDLVTYSSNRDYSLSKYLYDNDVIYITQKEIEEDIRTVNRTEFYNYLCWVKTKLQEANIQFIYTKVNTIYNNYVETNIGNIKYDYLVLALGTQERQIPLYLKEYNKIDNKQLIQNEYKSLLIIGSGQGAYDIANYLHKKEVNVGLYITKDAKINRYPVPDYSIWQSRSALGNYCSSLISIEAKQRYIKSVKEWAPSITPDNEYLLTTIPIYKNLNIKEVLSKYNNNYVYRAGVTPINLLNINQADITNNFRVKGTSIFITGPLAILYDGPRSNSIISSSSTAIRIIEEIELDATI